MDADTFHEFVADPDDDALEATIALPALHYLPRTFDEHWTPSPMGSEVSRPSYISVGGEPVIFCLCGRVRDILLCADDGGPIEDVFVDIAPMHHADGTAIITLIRRVGFHARGEYALYILFHSTLICILVQKAMAL